MFKQGKTPIFTLPTDRLLRLTEALHASGYERHQGARITRQGEVVTWRKKFGATPAKLDRQNHVQIVVLPGNAEMGVFAHTEPSGYGWNHLVSAVCDRANYGAGAAMLLKDIREKGYEP